MKIAVIGAGNMGLSFSNSFIKNGKVEREEMILVEAREESHAELKKQGYITVTTFPDQKLSDCRIVILAVKPQDFKQVAGQLKGYLHEEQIILSIMAGVTIENIQKELEIFKVVRCMPNTPAKLGFGITGFYAANLHEDEYEIITSLLECTGTAVKVESEDLINAVTALSGSGPAYFYYFLRSMVNAGVGLGLAEDLARTLATETMYGAYKLVKESEASFDDLIKAVTSKGGTTEAALGVFENYNIAQGIENGILRAETRARELSQNS